MIKFPRRRQINPLLNPLSSTRRKIIKLIRRSGLRMQHVNGIVLNRCIDGDGEVKCFPPLFCQHCQLVLPAVKVTGYKDHLLFLHLLKMVMLGHRVPCDRVLAAIHARNGFHVIAQHRQLYEVTRQYMSGPPNRSLHGSKLYICHECGSIRMDRFGFFNLNPIGLDLDRVINLGHYHKSTCKFYKSIFKQSDRSGEAQ